MLSMLQILANNHQDANREKVFIESSKQMQFDIIITDTILI